MQQAIRIGWSVTITADLVTLAELLPILLRCKKLKGPHEEAELEILDFEIVGFTLKEPEYAI
jgi:hypothetical protein